VNNKSAWPGRPLPMSPHRKCLGARLKCSYRTRRQLFTRQLARWHRATAFDRKIGPNAARQPFFTFSQSPRGRYRSSHCERSTLQRSSVSDCAIGNPMRMPDLFGYLLLVLTDKLGATRCVEKLMCLALLNLSLPLIVHHLQVTDRGHHTHIHV
jgi:hypothetical protein